VWQALNYWMDFFFFLTPHPIPDESDKKESGEDEKIK